MLSKGLDCLMFVNKGICLHSGCYIIKLSVNNEIIRVTIPTLFRSPMENRVFVGGWG